MSKLEELIQKLCPSGVEYKKLGDLATISRGGSFQKKDYVESGVPCIHYGQIYVYYGLFVEETISFISEEVAKKQRFAQPNDVIMAVTSENIEDVCKCVAWLGNEQVAVSGHTAIIHHSLNPKYMVYFLRSEHFYKQKVKLAHGTKVIEVRPDDLKDIVIPVPPIEVQREIVRILDNFTEQMEELQKYLGKELEARKIQIEYEKNKLLSFDDTVSYVRLDSFYPSIRNGFVGTVTKFFSDKEHGVRYLEGRNIHSGIISNDEEIYVTKEFHAQHLRTELHLEDIVMVQSGHVGECAVVGPDIAGANCHALIIMSNAGECNSRFMMHYFYSEEGKKQLAKITTGETVKHILASAMQKFLVPSISLEEQNGLVKRLDSLDESFIELQKMLTNEIDARKKQYEYYKDKCLTFKEKVS